MLEPGLCVIEMDYAPGVSQQNGYFHGGAVGAIADSAAGYAAYSLMPAGSDILTVEYKLNLIRPAVPPTLRAEGRVVRAGKTLSVCRADVYCAADGRRRSLRPAAVDADATCNLCGQLTAHKKNGPCKAIGTDQNDKRGECRRSSPTAKCRSRLRTATLLYAHNKTHFRARTT